MSCSMPQAFALQQSPAGTSLAAIGIVLPILYLKNVPIQVKVVPDVVNVQTDKATGEWAGPSLPHVPAWRQKLTHLEASLLGGLWSSG